MNKKNKGFSLFIAIVAALMLLGVSIGIIASINRSIEQAKNIAQSNQSFFAIESGEEAALFHHSVRGAGMNLDKNNSNQEITHNAIGKTVTWSIEGRSDEIIEGKLTENEKVTIPLYWENSDNIGTAYAVNNLSPTNRSSLELSFSGDITFDFGTITNDVLIVWSVSRIKGGELETFIPSTPVEGDPCAAGASFYCKSDFNGSGTQHFPPSRIIEFNSSSIDGIILPTNVTSNLSDFVSDASSTKYEISFQPIRPFTALNGNKISKINFRLEGNNNTKIPRNIYTIVSEVDLGDIKKSVREEIKEIPSIGVFDYVIFK